MHVLVVKGNIDIVGRTFHMYMFPRHGRGRGLIGTERERVRAGDRRPISTMKSITSVCVKKRLKISVYKQVVLCNNQLYIVHVHVHVCELMHMHVYMYKYNCEYLKESSLEQIYNVHMYICIYSELINFSFLEYYYMYVSVTKKDVQTFLLESSAYM